MFGLSLAETAIILVVAVVVIGPKELPAVLRAVMKTVGQLRGLAGDFRRNFDELAHEAQLQELSDEITASRPTIVDLDGNEQPTYDISEEMAAYETRRTPKKDASDEQ